MTRNAVAARRLALALVGLGALALGSPARAEPSSLVFLNGRPMRVFFNDGDSFRVLAGSEEGTKARLAGFNTLESFGPTHSWGTWTKFETYVLAKQATLNARRGVWHCTTDNETDTYGRILVHCPDLIVDQLKKGLAHAFTITEEPAPPEYLRAQHEAIRAKRGMWAHGVPEFVMSSVHSADEGRADNYNRLISTRDGHTEKWFHQDEYSECQTVCNTELRFDAKELRATARRMREHPEVAPLVATWFNLNLEEFVAAYLRKGELPGYLPAETRVRLRAFLAEEKAAGRLHDGRPAKGACMMFVKFERWYGMDRAPCLAEKKH